MAELPGNLEQFRFLCSEPRASARADSPVPCRVEQVKDRYTKTESAVGADHTACAASPADVVLAFDIDNLLLDPEGTAYRSTVSKILSQIDLGLEADEALFAYESLRAGGDVLQRCGLGNPMHDRGHPDGLAVLCLTRCESDSLRRELGIPGASQNQHRAILSELVALDSRARTGPFPSRLESEVRLRTMLATDSRAYEFRNEVRRIARHPRVGEWSKAFRDFEREQPIRDHAPLLASLRARQTATIAISEGTNAIQAQKLERLGLRRRPAVVVGSADPTYVPADPTYVPAVVGSADPTYVLGDRTLVTEAASSLPGLAELDHAIDGLFHEIGGTSGAAPGDELYRLWYFRCLIDAWSTKSPWFYARCLHALHQDREHPASSFHTPLFVDSDAWRRNPLRFVMVGDRYDKDVAPLIDLLGPGIGMKIRLRMGKYGQLHPESEMPPDRRPDRTFTDWDSLQRFLIEELTPDMVTPITRPPDLVDRSMIRHDYIQWGLESPYEAVRCVARTVSDMLASS